MQRKHLLIMRSIESRDVVEDVENAYSTKNQGALMEGVERCSPNSYETTRQRRAVYG